MSVTPRADWIQPVLGRADDMRAEIWLRCECPTGTSTGASPVVSGTLSGPECTTAATLPTTATLVDQGHLDGQPPLARAVCTEPGFWTPELPNLYRAEVVVRRGEGVVATGRRMVGLRRLGTRGRSLWLDGRRWVPRGVPFAGTAVEDLPRLRSLSAAALLEDGDAEAGPGAEVLLEETDRIGVAVVVRVAADLAVPVDLPSLARRLEAWSAHPSVMVALLPVGLTAADVAAVVATAARRRGTMLLGQEFDGQLPPPASPPGGLDCLAVRLPEDGVPHEAWQRAPERPLLALAAAETVDPEESRAACDRLQGRLAAWARPEFRDRPWDWAGYLLAASGDRRGSGR